MAFKNTYKSVSGWERSYFGGYNRLIWDHPYVSIDYTVDIIPDKELKKDFGYSAEKLIKMYLIKIKELGLLGYFKTRIETRKSLFSTKKFEVISLKNESVLFAICQSDQELAPLFEHHKNGIFGSSIEREIQEDDNEEEGKGKGKKDKEQGGGGGGKKGIKNEGDQDQEDQEGQGQGDQEGDDQEDQDGQGQGDQEGDDQEDQDGDGEGDGEDEQEQNEDEKPANSTKLGEMIGRMKKDDPFTRYSSRINGAKKNPSFKAIPECTPYRFKDDEIKNGEALVKMLDISFDPKSDVVKNLKVGKLDVSKIAEVPAGNLSVYKQTVEEQDTKPFTVCILADMSGSMRGNRITTQFSLLNSLYLGLSQILPSDKLFIYGHTGEQEPEIYTFFSPYEQEYDKRINAYHRINFQENYDGPVIEVIHEKIRKMTDDRIIFISLSDGEPCGYDYGGGDDYKDLKRILEKCRRDEFVTVGIGIQAEHVKDLYQYPVVVNDLSNMIKEVSNMINKVVRIEFK